MKKYYVFTALVISVFVFSYCHSSKKAMAAVPKATYENSVSLIISEKCSPCHIPAKGGRKKAYDNFAAVQADIDEMIHRISLNPTDRGFMPFKGAKLSDSAIAVFTKWKADGMMEK